MSLDRECFATPAGHARDHPTVASLAGGFRSTTVVIEFGEEGPSLKRIQITDLAAPSPGWRPRRRRPTTRMPARSWPEVAGMVVGGWPEALRAGAVAVALGASTAFPPSGAGAAGTAVTGLLCVLAVRGLRGDTVRQLPHQVP
ncbi:hypothetical protein ACFXPA_25525 [Amycolatopsis sp. NPDC059090]|uniref:hypothetical protein n=1 Tax=unclassified Amycolatopsis TaxID=2618356 RepID=UPI00366C1003